MTDDSFDGLYQLNSVVPSRQDNPKLHIFDFNIVSNLRPTNN